eukprot:6390218-Lingulodinium_polyedra.AAC.1
MVGLGALVSHPWGVGRLLGVVLAMAFLDGHPEAGLVSRLGVPTRRCAASQVPIGDPRPLPFKH